MEKNVIQINGKITINVNVGVKKSCMLKILFPTLLHVNVKNKKQKYLASIMNDLAVICDEVIDGDDETKAISTNFNEKKVTCKTQNFYLLLAVLLITIALLTVVCIYC